MKGRARVGAKRVPDYPPTPTLPHGGRENETHPTFRRMDIQQRRPSRGGNQPFDQRFLLFAVVALAILMFTSRPPVGEKPVDEADRVIAAEKAAPDAEAEAGAGLRAAEEVAQVEAEVEANEETAIEEEPAAKVERIALGSVAPDGGYRMLMTVNNVGAGVERVELSSPDYRDLDDRSGYLGQLALTDAPAGGALVNVVGSGTPAEEAGLQPGDVIISATAEEQETVEIKNAEDLRLALNVAKPRKTIALTVVGERGERSVTAKLVRQPLDLMRPEIENVRLHTPTPPEDFKSAASFLVRLDSIAGRRSDDPTVAEANRRLTEEAWTVDERSADGLTLRMRLAALGVEFVKRFQLIETPAESVDDPTHASYHFDLTVEARNLKAEPQAIVYELTGPNGLPIEGFWYANKIGRGDGSFFGDWGSFGLRDVVVRFANDRLTQFAAVSVADGDVPPMGQGKPLAFVGVDSQYFASVILPLKESLETVRTAEIRTELPTPKLATTSDGGTAQPRWQNASCVLQREPITLGPAGEESATVSDGYRVFAGPKLPALLDKYAANDDDSHTLVDVPYYGWFGWAAKPMLWLLHTFYALVGNYGLAIILLTICVRGAMFPISRQTAMNMVKMQELKPELDRLTERYGEDMQKRAAAQQELFRKHKYNPAAGCLPLFIQLPIFMGLYRALAVDVELRQQPLFSDAVRFCSNLAAPDMFIDWSAYTPLWMDNGLGMLGLGPYFNLLPIASCLLMLMQQKLFMPEATNEQGRMQQMMMKYMMLFMGFMFFKMPSGLCLYFVTTTLWGIAERKMLPKPAKPDPSTSSPVTPLPSKPAAAPGAVAAAKKKAANKKKSKGKKR